MGEYISSQPCSVVKFPLAIPSKEVGGVERLNPFTFFDFGKRLQVLSEMSTDAPTPASAAFWPVWQAKYAIDNLLKGDPIPLGISKHKASTLAGSLQSIMDARFSTKDETGRDVLRFPEQGDPPLEAYHFSYLRQVIEQFENVFADEMRDVAAYYVPRRGIYYTPSLVDAADETFPPDLLLFIPAKALEDWRSAGRCLAFNLLSASGFHVARAVEATLEAYYGLYSGKQGTTLESWHAYIDALKDIVVGRPTPSPMDKTIAELNQMRDDYRNPIMHPRVVLGEGDARMLFANGESLIIAMAQEMAASSKGVQPSLALVGGKASEAL